MLNLLYLYLAVPLLSCSLGTPRELGIKFETEGDALPTLTLPYGTWRASKYTTNASSLGPFLPSTNYTLLTVIQDLSFQKHSIWSSAGREFKMGKTGSST